MTRFALLLVCFLAACGYSHVGETKATFRQADKTLSLRVDRHLDTVMRGPDVEEDQRLILELSGYEIGKRLPVPSANAVARFSVTRFGPSSEGNECTGYIILKRVAEKKIEAYLHLDITAHTANGSYVQHVKYRGDHTFYDRVARDD
jgi:hypothetical protein